jgi:hypothetical protein
MAAALRIPRYKEPSRGFSHHPSPLLHLPRLRPGTSCKPSPTHPHIPSPSTDIFHVQLKNNQKHTLRFLLALGTTLPSLLLSLTTTVYAHILNGNSPDLDTIQTWTCKYAGSSSLEQDLDTPTPADLGNGNFGALCRESRFSIWGMLVVFLVLSFGMAVSFAAWLADKWVQREARKEQEQDKEMSGTPSV